MIHRNVVSAQLKLHQRTCSLEDFPVVSVELRLKLFSDVRVEIVLSA